MPPGSPDRATPATVEVSCFGHPSIRATHSKSLEISLAPDISRRATCVIGVRANFEPAQLRQLRGQLTVDLEAGGKRERFEAQASPFYLDGNLVFRKGPPLRERTLAGYSSKGAADLDRGFVSSLTATATEMRVTISSLSPQGEGVLYVVAVPIGNRDDLTPRAARVLAAADIVLAEDTRRFRSLAGGLLLPVTRVESHHVGNEASSTEWAIERLREGKRLAIVTDAGTPTASDPGARLVRGALDAGIPVRPVPGASAVLAALAGSGLRADEFTFGGFLPHATGPRRRRLEDLIGRGATVVVFESPRRLLETLADIADLAPTWTVCLAREMTKMHEEFLRGTASELQAQLDSRRDVLGECTLVLGAPGRREGQSDDRSPAVAGSLEAFARALLAEGVPVKVVASALAAVTGTSRNDAYDLLLSWRQGGP